MAPKAPRVRTDPYLTKFYGHPLFAEVSEDNFNPAICDFVLACSRRFGRRHPRSGLELACGLAMASMGLARRGLSMRAVDISPELVRRARSRARSLGLAVRVSCGNLLRYRARPPADFSFSLGLNSSCLLSNDEMISHLRAVAASLVPGGVYLADFELVLTPYLLSPTRVEPPWLVYEAGPIFTSRSRRKGREVRLEYGGDRARYDPMRQVFASSNCIVVGGRKILEVPSVGKLYHPLELRALVAQSGGFDWMGAYADYSLDRPLEGYTDTRLYVAVLRRR
jgi:SAM-dependent methyltransferase